MVRAPGVRTTIDLRPRLAGPGIAARTLHVVRVGIVCRAAMSRVQFPTPIRTNLRPMARSITSPHGYSITIRVSAYMVRRIAPGRAVPVGRGPGEVHEVASGVLVPVEVAN